MNKNYITITYKGLQINIECKNRIFKGGNVYAYFNNIDELDDVTNIFDSLGINYGTINTPKTIGIVASVKDLFVVNENNIENDIELYKSIQFIRSTENLVTCLKNKICDNLSLIKTIIDNTNKLQDSAAVDSAMDIQRTLQLIHANVNHLEQRMFFAKPDINKKVLLSSQFD